MAGSSSDRQVTMREIAKRSGVSIATVSRVLSESGYPVSESVRSRVLAIAESLHYMPNDLGRSLRTRNTRVVGVILPNITNPYYAQLLQGIDDAAMRAEFRVLFLSAHRDPALEEKSIEMLLRERVMGMLLASIRVDSAAVQRAQRMGLRVITLEQKQTLDVSHIGFDYRAGAQIMLEHLLSLGHQRIAYVGAPLDRFSRIELLEGYRASLLAHGITPRREYEWLGIQESDSVGIYELENGQACVAALTGGDEAPTACFCINDMTALGLIAALRQRGIRVPEDISVTGFDNIPMGEVCVPPLTTIHQHAYQMGKIAFEQLMKQLNTENSASYTLTLTPELILRESTAPVSR